MQTDCPVQRVIDDRYARIMAAQKLAWEHLRRSQGQRWRHLREQLLGEKK